MSGSNVLKRQQEASENLGSGEFEKGLLSSKIGNNVFNLLELGALANFLLLSASKEFIDNYLNRSSRKEIEEIMRQLSKVTYNQIPEERREFYDYILEKGQSLN